MSKDNDKEKTGGDDLVSISNKLQFLANDFSKKGTGKQVTHLLGGKFGGVISVSNLLYKINNGTEIYRDYLNAASDVAYLAAAYVTSDDTEKHLNVLLNLVNEYELANPEIPGDSKTTRPPIIIDLDRDGIETISKDKNIHFDLNSNQFAKNTRWIGLMMDCWC